MEYGGMPLTYLFVHRRVQARKEAANCGKDDLVFMEGVLFVDCHQGLEFLDENQDSVGIVILRCLETL